MKFYALVYMFVLINLLDGVQSDAISLSIGGMEGLVSSETLLLDNLELYLGALTRKVEIIQSNLNRMRAENEKALLDAESYLMNPLQAFSLLRRLHSDWLYWELYMEKHVGEEFVDIIKNARPTLPTEEEIQEAAEGMFRLQDTYGLNPIEMSVGKLNGIQYSANLSAFDCFSIASYLQGSERHEEAALWFQSAINLFKDTDTMNEVLEFDMKKVYHSYAQTYAKQGLLDRAVQLLGNLLNIDPEDTSALGLKQKWELEIKTNKTLPVRKPAKLNPAAIRYQTACRGKYPARVPNLYCLYNTTTDPFLKLAPLKMEIISLDPYIILYHDVMSDADIEVFKNLSKPNLQRSRVYDQAEKKVIPVAARTSKFAWFPDDFNPEMKRLHQRVADMTGFNLDASEKVQVMNYGLGGHYARHFDYFNTTANGTYIGMELGNRVATALFYMTDVEQGGATAFVNAKLAVFPKKGSCLFWYNLNFKGDGNAQTLHAACPVIVGSKWVSNKWIREREQLFRKPCWRQ